VAQLRIGLTISGAVSLGAYEGGALAALLGAVQAINADLDAEAPDRVRVDAIAGASAGSITGLLAARTLLAALDPVDVMFQSWVVQPDLGKLIGKEPHQPLSIDAVRANATKLLSGEPKHRRQKASVRINMAVVSLRGLDFEIGRMAGAPLDVTTYLDWGEFKLDREQEDVKHYTEPKDSSPVDVAVASGAHLAAFPPRKLDRRGLEPEYKKRHMKNFPETGFLWYTDGGTIDNQPLGRALDLSNQVDAETDDPALDEPPVRLHLLITPDPEQPASPKPDEWSDPATQPPFIAASSRAAKLLRSQPLYQDLNAMEKTNSRVAWMRQVADRLAELLEDPKEDRERALTDLLGSLKRQKGELFGEQAVERPETTKQTTLGKLVADVLGAASGLGGKSVVEADVISPRIRPDVASGEVAVKDLLAGEQVFAFGGFLDERYRTNDFAIGYDDMLAWMEDPERGLAARGVGDAATAGIEAARRARGDWPTGFGKCTIGDAKGRRNGWRLILRTLWIVFRELREHPFRRTPRGQGRPEGTAP
jgi:predicted acylesterase/phospholipase RssA